MSQSNRPPFGFCHDLESWEALGRALGLEDEIPPRDVAEPLDLGPDPEPLPGEPTRRYPSDAGYYEGQEPFRMSPSLLAALGDWDALDPWPYRGKL